MKMVTACIVVLSLPPFDLHDLDKVVEDDEVLEVLDGEDAVAGWWRPNGEGRTDVELRQI